MKILIKLDRFFAWVLFCGMLLYFISGYGMTKGIIDASLASKIHLDILTYIILVAFSFHTCYAIHMALKRWRIWNMPVKVLLFIFFAAFFGSFVYVDRYYQQEEKTSVQSGLNENIKDGDQNNASDSSVTTEEKTFTLSELSKYNGENGNPAYVAVDGNVYDLSSVFQAGKHYSHYAGKELTSAFYSYHIKSALSKYPMVGKIVK